MIIKCNQIYTENGIIDGFLEVENGKFINIQSSQPTVSIDLDATGQIIIPGIIDTHNHGCFGFDMSFNPQGATNEEISGYLKALATQGVTGVFPTVSGQLACIQAIADYQQESLNGARICGIHSEGPWGSRVGEKGVNTGYPSVDLQYAQKMIELGQGKLKLVDIAPEVPLALDAIRYFTSQNVTVSAYHTSANYKEANLGIDAGITVATHLGNVMTGLHHRDIGVLGASLLRPEVDCEIICDDMHISLEMIRVYFKVKDQSRFMMISDNVRYAGLPQGHYKGSTSDPKSDRKTITITEDGFVLSETGRLSGSSKPVIYGMKNLVQKLKLPLEDVVKMSSLNPARKYNLTNKGSIKKGNDADFVIIDNDFNVLQTYTEGINTYNSTTDVYEYNQAFLDEFLLSK